MVTVSGSPKSWKWNLSVSCKNTAQMSGLLQCYKLELRIRLSAHEGPSPTTGSEMPILGCRCSLNAWVSERLLLLLLGRMLHLASF